MTEMCDNPLYKIGKDPMFDAKNRECTIHLKKKMNNLEALDQMA